MIQVAGITIERTMRGKPVFGRVDFRKHPDMISVFEAKGVEMEESPYNKKFVEEIKSQEKLVGVKIKAKDIWNSY